MAVGEVGEDGAGVEGAREGICGDPVGWNKICAFVIRSSHKVSYGVDVKQDVKSYNYMTTVPSMNVQ